MKIIKFEIQKKAEILSQALDVLLAGGTIVYPTETAYALGGDFYSDETYKRVHRLKGRDFKRPLPVIVPDASYARRLVSFSEVSSVLASHYWPGALTMVLPFLYAEQLSHHRDKYLALRVSSYPLTQSLVRAFGRPLISTSANVSGRDTNYDVGDIVRQFTAVRRYPDLIIDVGRLPFHKASTVVKVDGDKIDILRQGDIHID